jgi:hypothetical protein
MVEHRLFDTWHAAGLRLRFHAQTEGIGTLTEGLLAVADDGSVVGANSNAATLLDLARDTVGRLPVRELLGVDVAALHTWARSPTPRAVQRPDGQRLWLRCEAAQQHPARAAGAARHGAGRAPPALPRAPAVDALAALDTGDATMRQLITARTARAGQAHRAAAARRIGHRQGGAGACAARLRTALQPGPSWP